MALHPKWQVCGPYEDGKFALIERVGHELFSRGMLGSRKACLDRKRDILAKRRSEKAK